MTRLLTAAGLLLRFVRAVFISGLQTVAVILKSGRPVVKEYFHRILASPDYKPFATLGGAGHVRWAHENGLMSTRNYRDVTFTEGEGIDGAAVPSAAKKTRKSRMKASRAVVSQHM